MTAPWLASVLALARRGCSGEAEASVPPELARRRALETGRVRLIVTGFLFFVAFTVIAVRFLDVTLLAGGEAPRQAKPPRSMDLEMDRADITDRNGVLLATSLPTVSLYAKPKEIPTPDEAAAKLVKVLPELHQKDVAARLGGDRSFIYIRRNLTPKQQYEVNALGIPGLYFEKSERRVYPQGPLAAHVVGMTDIDNKGIAGIEKSFDATLHGSRDPLRLAIDLRVQTVLREELTRSMNDFHAIGAIGMVMDVRTGELAGMVSLPDFDPNAPSDPQAMFNRATLGVYEMGSTFKLFNTAISLDLGLSNLGSAYDTSPIKVGKFTITDYHPFNRPLSVTEILIHSSNLGSARMALEYGTENQKAFLAKFGLLKAPHVELPEVGTPLVPSPWREINTMTISYGHGIAVTPVHLITGVSALVNGGEWRPATLLKHEPGTGIAAPRQVIKPETSEKLRKMMRMVVESGTGSKADVPGYFVGGKTGTAEKLGAGGYRHKALLSSFIATFPTIDPKYVVLAMIDEPQGTKESFGYATGGWVAAPAVGRIVSRIGPMLGIAPIGVPEVQREQMVRHAIAKEPKVAAAE